MAKNVLLDSHSFVGAMDFWEDRKRTNCKEQMIRDSCICYSTYREKIAVKIMLLVRFSAEAQIWGQWGSCPQVSTRSYVPARYRPTYSPMYPLDVEKKDANSMLAYSPPISAITFLNE